MRDTQNSHSAFYCPSLNRDSRNSMVDSREWISCCYDFDDDDGGDGGDGYGAAADFGCH